MNKFYSQALERFKAVSFPHKKDEHWRFADLKFWGEAIAGFLKISEEKDCMLSEIADSESLRFFNSLLEGGKFDALCALEFCKRKVIKIKAGEKVLLNSDFGAKANIIVLEEGAELEILQKKNFASEEFFAEANCFVLGKNSKLKINRFFSSKENAPRYTRSDYYLAEGASVNDVFVENGKTNTRAERNYFLEGAGSSVNSYALLDCSGSITHDFRSSQIHKIEGAHSRLGIKNILSDVSRSAFMGLIRVEENAQKTEAYQHCRSLLLSANAKASASPILEIMANDVACSHGCAVARPDEEQIFYMQSRGLSERVSKRLLVAGFADEILSKISNPDFAAEIQSALEK